ncbi:MAG TPA: OsmC family peroxiredoxin [Candidatus Limnocylindria bacterium]|nr:OsmC family peroxiredoxin [Candidatus Limnocylindria bacterium]
MPTVHEATATWRGDLTGGKGTVSTKSGALKQAATSWKERTEGTGSEGATSPEELLAAAHASCFAMAFSVGLAKAGVADPNITVTAKVTFGPNPAGGNGVLSSVLTVRAQAPNGDGAKLKAVAEEAKENCPISKALEGNVALSVEATPS